MSSSPTPAELRKAIFEALKGKDLTKTSHRVIRHAAEAAFGGIHLRDRKEEIYKYIVEFVESGDDDAGGSAQVWKDRKLPGLKIPMELTPEMSAFCGEEYLNRSDIVKKIWAHIHEQNLQDSENKKNINLDAKLKSLLGNAGEDSIDMVEIQKRLGKHLKGRAPDAVVEAATKRWNDEQRAKPPKARASKKSSASKSPKSTGSAASSKAEKKPKKKAPKGSQPPTLKGVHKPMELSGKLEAVVHAKHLSRPQVVKGLWNYIREHSLQDPENKRTIKCDDKLKAVFEQDTVQMFEMSKLVAKHLLKPSPPDEAQRILEEATKAWREEFPQYAAEHDAKNGGAATGGAADAEAGDDE